MGSSKEDFEGVVRQLKQLEELVAELEEGLEESRRGEAEARGEVEFLRGEVERGREERRRDGAGMKEAEQKDDEIRGLKAIIHSLSSGSNSSAATKESDSNSEQLKRVEELLEESSREKEDLLRELETLRRNKASTNGNGHAATHVRNESQRTATATERGLPSRERSGTVRATFAERARVLGIEEDDTLGDIDGDEYENNGAEAVDDEHHTNGAAELEGYYCEMCESRDHDTLVCAKLKATHGSSFKKHSVVSENGHETAHGNETGHAYSPGKENSAEGGKKKAAEEEEDEEDKWCALCEKDGHFAFDCPEEQY